MILNYGKVMSAVWDYSLQENIDLLITEHSVYNEKLIE